MKRSTVINAIAILLSLLFCLVYFGFFSLLTDKEIPTPKNSLSTKQPEVVKNEDLVVDLGELLTLYWVQLGIFASQSSVDEIKNRLMEDGFEVITYQKNELTVVVSGVNTSKIEAKKVHELLKQKKYDTYFKSASISSEQQKEQLRNSQYKKILEGLK